MDWKTYYTQKYKKIGEQFQLKKALSSYAKFRFVVELHIRIIQYFRRIDYRYEKYIEQGLNVDLTELAHYLSIEITKGDLE